MKIANTDNMKKFFADYIRHDGDWDVVGMSQAFMKATRAINIRSVCEAMDLADVTMHGHGVEEIVGFKNLGNEPKTVALYVNTGDTYNATVIYDCLANKFYVGTWGDWYEWREKNEDYGLEEED